MGVESEIVDLIDEQVQEAVSQAVNNAVENAIEEASYDFINGDTAYEIARDCYDEYDHSDNEGFNIYEANQMLNQVAEGRDCSDGNSFREAVKSIINAQMLSNGASADDGSDMTVKATGSEREIQAILTRRREYFLELHSTLNNLLGRAPNGDLPPINSASDQDRLDWENELMQTVNARVRDLEEYGDGDETITVPKHILAARNRQTDRLWDVAKASTNLLGLLSGLSHGESGESSLRVAQIWRSFANRVCTESTNSMRVAQVTEHDWL